MVVPNLVCFFYVGFFWFLCVGVVARSRKRKSSCAFRKKKERDIKEQKMVLLGSHNLQRKIKR